MFGALVLISLLVLICKGLVIRSQLRLIGSDEADNASRKRLYILAGREGADCLLFIGAVGVLPLVLPDDLGMVSSFFVVLGGLVTLWIVRWATYDLRLWRLQASATTSLKAYMVARLINGLKALVWFIPVVGGVFWLVNNGALFLTCGLFLLMNWGGLYVLPAVRAKRGTKLEAAPHLSVPSIAVFKDVSETAPTQANARSLAGLLSSSIIFTPALEKLLASDEFRAVISHEKGHLVHRHHLIWLCVMTAKHCLFFYIAYALLHPHFSNASLVLAMMTFYFFFQFLWAPLAHKILHHFEYQADAYAGGQSGADSFMKALQKIWSQNKSTIRESALYSLFYSSHPAPSARLKRLRKNEKAGREVSLS